MLSCSIRFSAPSFWMGGGLESRCVGRVCGADGAVRCIPTYTYVCQEVCLRKISPPNSKCIFLLSHKYHMPSPCVLVWFPYYLASMCNKGSATGNTRYLFFSDVDIARQTPLPSTRPWEYFPFLIYWSPGGSRQSRFAACSFLLIPFSRSALSLNTVLHVDTHVRPSLSAATNWDLASSFLRILFIGNFGTRAWGCDRKPKLITLLQERFCADRGNPLV